MSEEKEKPIKQKRSDFYFYTEIGEGSFSSVYKVCEKKTDRILAIKELDKQLIIRERKKDYVFRERHILVESEHPNIIKFFSSFQDESKLYFVLEYCEHGDVLRHLTKNGSFSYDCARFYAAELVSVVQYLQSKNIIHRDIKPENCLFNSSFHLLLTDFGSAKILTETVKNKPSGDSDKEDNFRERKASFVGTAQFIAPEILQSNPEQRWADLWSIGCVLFQFITGLWAFHGNHEYEIFRKVVSGNYNIPDEMEENTSDLIKSLLVVKSEERLGSSIISDDMTWKEAGRIAKDGIENLKKHKFFEGINWERLSETIPPPITPYLPPINSDPEPITSEIINLSTIMSPSEVNMFQVKKLIGENFSEWKNSDSINFNVTIEEKRKLLEKQREENPYHRLVNCKLIFKQGLLSKRRGLTSKKRMYLLTSGPHLYYVDQNKMEFDGEITWNRNLFAELKDFKNFFIHTPNQIFYLKDDEARAIDWCQAINDYCKFLYKSSN
ncbi:hypothetical protein SNEBB_001091 [Seison nebaliae]|nr:hypothetical protein SNEBB_001091 [Seison nebaliae]